MKLNLQRPLLFFDIESTGLSVAGDSIIELSFVKVLPDGEERTKTWRIRPWDYETRTQKKISPSATAVHGIHDEDLTECPRFCDIVDEVVDWLRDSDLAGFNSAKYDLPLLAEELERVRAYTFKKPDVNLHDKKMVDVQNIYHVLEPRNLKAAYKFYCGRDFENAHEAEADTMATYEVLKAQLDKYPETLKNDVTFLSNFTERQKNVDYAGRLALNDRNEVIITFGKHKGKTAREVYNTEPSYYDWIEKGEFTLDTKRQFEILKNQFRSERRQAAFESNAPLNDNQLRGATNRLAGRFNSGYNPNKGGTTGSLF
ncbi:MAG: 3'-5' exonuclease [Bacteroidales bacterium]|nr:3'-5' exonuclease [Bacteroidales bacterium]